MIIFTPAASRVAEACDADAREDKEAYLFEIARSLWSEKI
jgi:hypothetical protein